VPRIGLIFPEIPHALRSILKRLAEHGINRNPPMAEDDRRTHQTLAAIADQKLSLELGTLDLCFVVLLHMKSSGAGLASLSEQQLIDAFEYVCEALEPGAEHLRVRATHAIRRLREQRLLSRVDGAGVLRAGEYTLTRLAAGIVDFFITDESLTRESLTLLTRTLMLSLTEVADAARRARTVGEWQAEVLGPLRVTIADLVAGIERRQRGLDLQQEEFQREISSLLSADWFGALEHCQSLLDTTVATLRELNEVLLKDGHQLHTVLEDIASLAIAAGNETAEATVTRVIEQIDRILAWGSARQRAWSEYYDYVHRYLRDVVRLDPSRALTQRLRQLLAGEVGIKFSLALAASAPLRVLREVKPTEEPPPVRRTRRPKDTELEAQVATDPEQELRERVREQLALGISDLAELTRKLTQDLPPEQRFAVAGRIAHILATERRPLRTRERPWVPVVDALVIEQWHLENEAG
jgi:chromosome partition protein MukF